MPECSRAVLICVWPKEYVFVTQPTHTVLRPTADLRERRGPIEAHDDATAPRALSCEQRVHLAGSFDFHDDTLARNIERSTKLSGGTEGKNIVMREAHVAACETGYRHASIASISPITRSTRHIGGSVLK